MEQYELLWDYQQADIAVDHFEREMKNNANRKELIKYRDFLLEQQGVLKKIESDADVMSDRLEALRDEMSRLKSNVEEMSTSFKKDPPADVESVSNQVQQMSKLISKITHYEAEISKIHKDADIRDKQQRETRVRAAKARAEFDRIKEIYDKEYKDASAQLAKLKARVEKEARKVDKSLLDRYQQIKLHSSPPLTKIRDGRCGGCNMQLPAADMNKVRTGATYIECENCGRIILVTNQE